MQQQVAKLAKSPQPSLANRVQVLREVSRAGVIQVQASANHRIKVHAGGPVPGMCRSQSFVYTRGDVDVMPPGEDDQWQQFAESTSVTLELSPALLSRAAQDIGIDPARVSVAAQHQLRDPRIEHIAWALDAEGAHGHPGDSLFADSLSLGLAVHLLGRYRVSQPNARGLSKQQLRSVTSYIEEHLDRDLSLERLALVSALSMTHFKSLFRRSTGMPVHAYVVERRVERARQLLARGELPAAQVALEAGFAHQSHMARCMRRVLGVTPSALRARRGG